jgi:hypothetical protein
MSRKLVLMIVIAALTALMVLVASMGSVGAVPKKKAGGGDPPLCVLDPQTCGDEQGTGGKKGVKK